jgi:hypothetical protein
VCDPAKIQNPLPDGDSLVLLMDGFPSLISLNLDSKHEIKKPTKCVRSKVQTYIYYNKKYINTKVRK